MARIPKSQQTKQEIAESFEQCLLEKPLDKITIIDITEGSGVSRQMFYHYFSDRMELVRWVCCNYIKKPLYEKEQFVWREAVTRLLLSKDSNQSSYRNIIHSRYGRLLTDVLTEELYTLYYCVIRYRICRTLPEELVGMLKTYCTESAKSVISYFDEERAVNPAAVVQKMFEAMPMQLQILICERSLSVKDIFAERRLLNWAYES